MVEVWKDHHYLPPRNPHHLVERNVGERDALLQVAHSGHIRPRTEVDAGVGNLLRKILPQNAVPTTYIKNRPRIRRKPSRHLFELGKVELNHYRGRARRCPPDSWTTDRAQGLSSRAGRVRCTTACRKIRRRWAPPALPCPRATTSSSSGPRANPGRAPSPGK